MLLWRRWCGVTATQIADAQRLARAWDAAHPREPQAVTLNRLPGFGPLYFPPSGDADPPSGVSFAPGRVAGVGVGNRPARFSAPRRMKSTCPLTLRSSSAAQRFNAARTSGSVRSRNGLRGAMVATLVRVRSLPIDRASPC